MHLSFPKLGNRLCHGIFASMKEEKEVRSTRLHPVLEKGRAYRQASGHEGAR